MTVPAMSDFIPSVPLAVEAIGPLTLDFAGRQRGAPCNSA